jgi:hypothetical protein
MLKQLHQIYIMNDFSGFPVLFLKKKKGYNTSVSTQLTTQINLPHRSMLVNLYENISWEITSKYSWMLFTCKVLFCQALAY